MRISSRSYRWIAPVLGVLGVAMPMSGAAADVYPSRPVRVVVPYSPGGGTDVVTRRLAQRLSETTGQSFVVENRPGADATIGPALVAKTPPDGYTLLATSGVSFLITRSTMKDLPYDPMRDFAPVALFASVPMVLVGAPNVDAAGRQGPGRAGESESQGPRLRGDRSDGVPRHRDDRERDRDEDAAHSVQGGGTRAQRSPGRARGRDAEQHQLGAAATFATDASRSTR